MSTTDEEVIFTLISGTFLLLFLVVVVIIAAIRYQNRKQRHIVEMERLKQEAEQLMLKTRLEVQEKTLTDVSREIHDNIGQILSVVKLNLYSLQSKPEKVNEQIPDTLELVNNAIKDLRNLSKVLNTDFISKQPLTSLLQREADVINRAGAFELSLQQKGEEPALNSQKQLIIFRIAQECLQNTIKHAKATRVQIELDFLPSQLKLSIQDDGIGFDFEKAKHGNGYTNLMARASMIGATLQVKSRQGQGATISILAPL
jgi:two-component system, NarL family, sensor kinase